MITPGFTSRQSGSELSNWLPPGQSVFKNFAVVAAESTPRIDPPAWTFLLNVGSRPVEASCWSGFNALRRARIRPCFQ